MSFREELGWSAAWVALALLFNAGSWFTSGPQRGLELLTGLKMLVSTDAEAHP